VAAPRAPSASMLAWSTATGVDVDVAGCQTQRVRRSAYAAAGIAVLLALWQHKPAGKSLWQCIFEVRRLEVQMRPHVFTRSPFLAHTHVAGSDAWQLRNPHGFNLPTLGEYTDGKAR
jgi:hypothetical protein